LGLRKAPNLYGKDEDRGEIETKQSNGGSLGPISVPNYETDQGQSHFRRHQKKTVTFQATCSDLFRDGLLAINPEYLWIAGKGVWEDMHNPLHFGGIAFSGWHELDIPLSLYAGHVTFNGEPIKAVVSKELRAGRSGYTTNIIEKTIPDRIRKWFSRKQR
jgi:hypothetical protein